MANCSSCGGGNVPPMGVPTPPDNCAEIPSSLVSCFSGQQLPPELPSEGIPAAAVSYTPDPGACVPSATTVEEFLDKISTLYFDLFCPTTIAATGGSCSVLRVVNNKVVASTFTDIFNTCLSCIAATKLCPGKNGEVLTTLGGVAMWAPPTAAPTTSPAAITCTQVKGALSESGCIPNGTPSTFIGFGSSGTLVQGPAPTTSTGGSSAPTCTQIKSALTESGCIPSGTIAENIGLSATGSIVKSPPPAPSTGGGGVVLNCASLLPLLGSCPPLSTDPTPTFVLGHDANGNAEKWGSCTYIKNAVNRTNAANGSNGCLGDADPISSPDRLLGYDDTLKVAQWYTPVQRYMFEARGSMSQDQELPTTAGTLNNIISHWVNPRSYERGLLGAATWWDPTTGRITIKRSAFYRVSFAGLMIRTNAGVTGGTQQGHAYGGITVTRAAGTVDGTAYPAMVGILRTGEVPVVANGKDQDLVFAGEYFGPLAAGDQVWIRVVVANVPDNSYGLNRLYVKDDGRSHFTVVEEPSYTYTKI